MTTTPRGARLVASTANTAPAESARIAPPMPDDQRVEHLATRVRDGKPLSDLQRDWLPGRGSRESAPASLSEDLGLRGFAEYRGLAQAALAHDSDRRVLVMQAIALVKGEAARPDDPDLFVSRLRRLRGAVPAELSKALDLAETASFGNVADRLAERMSPKREGAR